MAILNMKDYSLERADSRPEGFYPIGGNTYEVNVWGRKSMVHGKEVYLKKKVCWGFLYQTMDMGHLVVNEGKFTFTITNPELTVEELWQTWLEFYEAYKEHNYGKKDN